MLSLFEHFIRLNDTRLTSSYAGEPRPIPKPALRRVFEMTFDSVLGVDKEENSSWSYESDFLKHPDLADEDELSVVEHPSYTPNTRTKAGLRRS